MTTPTTKPSMEGLRAAEVLLKSYSIGTFSRFCDEPADFDEAEPKDVARIIDEHANLKALLRIKEAAKDAHDFISVLHDATKGERQIDKHSILRYGERLKTTAAKLDEKLRAALSEAENT